LALGPDDCSLQAYREGAEIGVINQTTSQILGAAATGVVIAGYVPQIVHLIRQRCTAGMSVPAFSLWCLASFLFLIHAIMIGDEVFIVVQTVNLVAGALILGFCRKYKGRVCAFHRKLYGGQARMDYS
jgi:uncharacterized protein with PQ loop repeat